MRDSETEISGRLNPKGRLLFTADAKTGALKWEHKLCNGVINTLVPLSSHEVLATDFDGRITLVETRK